MTGLHDLNPELLDLMENNDRAGIRNGLQHRVPQPYTQDAEKMIQDCNGFSHPPMVQTFKSWVRGIDVR